MLTAENELRDKLVYLVLHQSRTDFLSFVKLVSPELVHDFKMGAHIKVISDKLQQIGKIAHPPAIPLKEINEFRETNKNVKWIMGKMKLLKKNPMLKSIFK